MRFATASKHDTPRRGVNKLHDASEREGVRAHRHIHVGLGLYRSLNNGHYTKLVISMGATARGMEGGGASPTFGGSLKRPKAPGRPPSSLFIVWAGGGRSNTPGLPPPRHFEIGSAPYNY